jgi:hypothetical protein
LTKLPNVDTNNIHEPTPYEVKSNYEIEPPSPKRLLSMNIATPTQDKSNEIPSPYAKDTAILYKNDTHNFVGFISNKNGPPQYMNGHWYYDIWTLGLGTIMRKCSNKYITLYEDTLTTQKDSPKTTIYDKKDNMENLKKFQQPIITDYGTVQPALNPTIINNPEPIASYHKQPFHTSQYLQKMSHNEFHYPKGSEPKQVWTSTMLKQASHNYE